jgi:aryl-alcohol dehydrogenase-like predicted oxidoreductase
VVPYPDKRNIAKVIPGSFDSNQLLAEQLSWNYVWPEVSQEVINLAKAQNELTLEYQSVVDKLTEDYTLWKITSEDLNRRIEEEKVNLDEAIQNLFAENEKLKEQINENLKNLNTAWLIKNPNTNTNTIIIAVLLIVLWITITFYVIAKKGKTKQE